MEINNLVANQLPVCPHCGTVVGQLKLETLEQDGGLNGDGDVVVTQCNGCDKDFAIKINITYSYTTCIKELDGYVS